MSEVTVKESSQVSHRRISRRMVSISLLAVLIALLLGTWFIYLPWLLRSKVTDALRAGGVRGIRFEIERATPWGSELRNVVSSEGQGLGVRRVVLDYSPIDLWEGKLDAIHVVGARLELKVHEGKIDFSPITKLIAPDHTPDAPTTQPAKLPISRIDFVESYLIIKTEPKPVSVPIDVTVVSANPGKVVVDARLGPNRNLIIGGMIDLAAKAATFEGAANAGWTLVTARAIWPDAQVGVDGFLQLAGSAGWGGDGLEGQLRVEIAPADSATQPAQPTGKLQLTSGVFVVTANLGSQPQVRLAVRDINFAVADSGLAGEGVVGDLLFNQISPLATPADQMFAARKLTVGQMNLTDGQVWLQMPQIDTINIRDTHWNWLGGQLFSQGIRIRGGEPIQMTLQLRDVELKGLLELLAKDKASGEGKLSGVLPITIDGSKVEFGDGRITAISGGTLQIKDADAVLPTAEAVASTAKDPTAAEEIKRNIIDALSDFVFERLSAQLVNEDGKLVGYVRIAGHGRTGAKQSLDYKLNLHGLDALLRSYVGIRAALTEPVKPVSTRKASP